jgi:hypothetical protein
MAAKFMGTNQVVGAKSVVVRQEDDVNMSAGGHSEEAT